MCRHDIIGSIRHDDGKTNAIGQNLIRMIVLGTSDLCVGGGKKKNTVKFGGADERERRV